MIAIINIINQGKLLWQFLQLPKQLQVKSDKLINVPRGGFSKTVEML